MYDTTPKVFLLCGTVMSYFMIRAMDKNVTKAKNNWVLTLRCMLYKMVTMTKVKGFVTPARKIALLLIACVFALSGLVGSAIAPLSHMVKLFAATGDNTVVIGNFAISGLERSTVELGETTITTPTMTKDGAVVTDTAGSAGHIRLFKLSSVGTGYTKVTYTSGTSKYDELGTYQWRFYAGDDGTTYPDDSHVHFHNVVVYQEKYEFAVPESADHRALGDTEISYVPNVVALGDSVLFPLPNVFRDKKGNDLFNPETEDVIELRTAFVKSFKSTAKGSGSSFTDYENLDKFKALVWANTTITFNGPGADKSNADIPSTGRYIWDIPSIPESNYPNGKTVQAARTLTTNGQPQGEYFAQYELKNSSFKATYSTSTVNVDYVSGVSNTNSISGSTVSDQLIFKMPFDFSNNISINSLSFNKPTTLPLPKVNIGTANDLKDHKPNGWSNPVQFSQSTITSYTFIVVEHYAFTANNGIETNARDVAILTERDDYKYTPRMPGIYSFRYYTTTMYGTGYTKHTNPSIKENVSISVSPMANVNGLVTYGTPVVQPAINGKFIMYYPHNLSRVNRNSTSPEFKWTVPYKIATTTDATTFATKGVQAGDAIALNDNALFDITAGDILERSTVVPTTSVSVPKMTYNSTTQVWSPILENGVQVYETVEVPTDPDANNSANKTIYFDKAPNLSAYVPSTGLTPVAQHDFNEPFVLPAVIGYNNVGRSANLQYLIEFKRYEDTTWKSVYFDSKITSHNDGGNRYVYDPTAPLVINFKPEVPQFKNGVAQSTYRNLNGTGGATGDGGWSDGKKFFPYHIILTVTDETDQNKQFGTNFGSTVTQSYSFTLTEGDTSYTMDDNDPEFGGNRITIAKQSYYENDTVSFREISVSDKHTNSVSVDYYLMWKTEGSSTEGAIKLDRKKYVKNGLVSFDFNPDDTNFAPFFTSSSGILATRGGVVELSVVAVARNYLAMMSQVNGTPDTYNFLPKTYTSGAGAWVGPSTPANGATSLKSFIDNYEATTPTPSAKNGISITQTAIKLYSLTHGKSPKIDVKPDITHSGNTAALVWKSYFVGGTGYGTNDSNVIANGGARELPNFELSYPTGEAARFQTSATFAMILPNGTKQNLFGSSSWSGGISAVATGSAPTADIKGLKFMPTVIGEHTFVMTVTNTGNFVTVFTAKINVVGTPTTSIKPIGRLDSLRVYQTGTLPGIELTIEGNEFVTDNGQIKVKSGTHAGEAVGELSITGSGPATVNLSGMQFTPIEMGTYFFTYNAKIESTKLNGVDISASKDFERTHVETVRVTAIESSEVAVDVLADQYKALKNQQYKTIAGGANQTYTVSDANLIPAMTIANNKNITLPIDDLNRAMRLKTQTLSLTGDDVYDFGPIFLPELYETKLSKDSANVLPVDYLSDGTRVTVTHSTNPSEPVFDSNNIAGKRNADPNKPENKIATLVSNGKQYYYFQPMGSVYISKPTGRLYQSHNASINNINTYNSTSAEKQTGTFPSSVNITTGGTAVTAMPTSVPTTDAEKFITDTITGVVYYWDSEKVANATGETFTDYKGWFVFDTERYEVDGKLNTWGASVEYNRNNKKMVGGETAPDGVYTVKLEFSIAGATQSIEYKIGIGDTATPRIQFKSGREERLFGETYRVGDSKKNKYGQARNEFAFNTLADIIVFGNAAREGLTAIDGNGNYMDWYVGRNLEISVTPPGGAGGMPIASTTAEESNKDYIQKRPTSNNMLYGWSRLASTYSDNFGYALADYYTESNGRYYPALQSATGAKKTIEGFAPTDATKNSAYENQIADLNRPVHKVVNDITNADTVNRRWSFALTQAGEYRITFSITSETGQTGYLSRSIIVEGKKGKTVIAPEYIWGTVLIVISSGLLIGVLVYFIQTGRGTKFAGTGALSGGNAKTPDAKGGEDKVAGAKKRLGLGRKKEGWDEVEHKDAEKPVDKDPQA